MPELFVPIQALHEIPLFRQLTQHELQELERLVRRRQLRKKSLVFLEGSDQKEIFFIQSGLVRTYQKDEKGEEHIAAYYKAGELLPPDGFDSLVYSLTAECIVQTVLFVLPLRPFEQFLLSHPETAVKIMRALSDHLQEVKRKQQLQGTPYTHCGQMFLLKLAEHYGNTRNKELRIGIPMTHQYLAQTIGSTTENAALFVNQLSREGIADMHRNGFVIHDVESLKRWKGI